MSRQDNPTMLTTEETLRAFLRTYGMVRRVMDAYFVQFGISGSQWGILRALDRAAKEGLRELRVTDLGQRLIIRPPSVTGTIDRLERMGLVSRRVWSQDMRVRQVSLTAAGRRLIQQVLAGLPAKADSVLGKLSQPERQTFYELLERLMAHLAPMTKNEEPANERL